MKLSSMLDLSAAKPLHAALLEARGADLELDASAVERVGGLCLEVLLAAKAQWVRDGHAFCVAAASQAFEDAVHLTAATSLNAIGANP